VQLAGISVVVKVDDDYLSLTPTLGYIGGSVLTKLLSHFLLDTFQIAVLVRDPAKAKAFEPLGVKPVIGSYSDHSLLRRLASEADVVFACVSFVSSPSTH
jgi:uncharacterized protein YbjT (DUF2867 family)